MRVRKIRWYRNRVEGAHHLNNHILTVVPNNFKYLNFSMVVWYCYGFLDGSSKISNRKRFEEEYFQWKDRDES